jgi:hypothetical protein
MTNKKILEEYFISGKMEFEFLWLGVLFIVSGMISNVAGTAL